MLLLLINQTKVVNFISSIYQEGGRQLMVRKQLLSVSVNIN